MHLTQTLNSAQEVRRLKWIKVIILKHLCWWLNEIPFCFQRNSENIKLIVNHIFMWRHCRHVVGQKQYIFSPLGNKTHCHAKLFHCLSPPTWPPWKPSIHSQWVKFGSCLGVLHNQEPMCYTVLHETPANCSETLCKSPLSMAEADDTLSTQSSSSSFQSSSWCRS